MGQMVNIVQNNVMRITALFFLIFIGNFVFSPVVAQDRYVLVIHGGAGTILKSQSTPEQEKRYKESLEQALHAGQLVLQKGGQPWMLWRLLSAYWRIIRFSMRVRGLYLPTRVRMN
jgi:hypothetical protein